MSADNPIKRLYVELDCILDTRLATISKIDQSVAKDLFNGSYKERNRDDFAFLTNGRVSNEEFIEAYKKRNVDTLQRARPTNILKLLFNIAKEIESQRIDMPDVERLIVEVNVFPYKLTDEEKDYLISTIMTFLTIGTEVKIIEYPMIRIDPLKIKDTWDAVIIYDFNGWFTLHGEKLSNVQLPRVLMFAPALYIKDPKELEEDIKDNNGISPFTAMELGLVERISLELLKPKEFSIISL